MKVNIFGKGVCPSIGGLLPKRNVEVSEVALFEILKKRLPVFDAKNGTRITLQNYKTICSRYFVSEVAKPIEPTPVVEAPKKKKKKQPVEEVSAIVETVEPVVFEEEKVEVIDEPMEEITAETETEVTLEAEPEESNDTESSEVSEVNETNQYHGKKNKKRNK